MSKIDLIALPTLSLALLGHVAPAMAAGGSHGDRMHARALESFRSGRHAEAYGRFIELANLGHPASARYALWMCEHGLPLFGKDWDCAQHEIDAWATAAQAPAFNLAAAARPAQRTSGAPSRR